jgi:hypothetical protein
VTSTFWYLKPLEEYKTVKPYHINVPQWALPRQLQSNEVSAPYPNIRVSDLRGRERDMTLDQNGFGVFEESRSDEESMVGCLTYDDYADVQKVLERGRPAVESFLKRTLGADAVVAFSHQVRRRDPQFPSLPRGTQGNIPQPVQGVHADYAPDWARSESRKWLERTNILDISNRRWLIINVWKPLFGPLHDWPLGLLDYTSVDTKKDLVASDNIYPHIVSETYNVHHNPAHRWFYLSGQMPHEILVFKSFDSKASKGNARVCPHAAFENSSATLSARRRESFECLAMVIFPEGTGDVQEVEEVLPSETLDFRR